MARYNAQIARHADNNAIIPGYRNFTGKRFNNPDGDFFLDVSAIPGLEKNLIAHGYPIQEKDFHGEIKKVLKIKLKWHPKEGSEFMLPKLYSQDGTYDPNGMPNVVPISFENADILDKMNIKSASLSFQAYDWENMGKKGTSIRLISMFVYPDPDKPEIASGFEDPLLSEFHILSDGEDSLPFN